MGACPYEDDDAVNVIGHNDECVGLNAGVKCWQFVPHVLNHLTCIVQSHLTIHHLAKQTRPILRADGDEIRTRLAVVVTFQSNAATMKAFGVKSH